MELEKRYIHKCETVSTAFYQSTVDDDYNLPDYRPDIMKIIRCRGKIINDEVKVGGQCVYLQGRMIFQVLYLSETMNGQISSINGEIPFREKVNMDQVEEFDPVAVTGVVKDISVGVINSRKINIRAIMDFTLVVKKMVDVQIPVSIDEKQGLQVRKCSKEILQLIEDKKDVIRIRQDISLPQDKPNASQLIWDSVLIQGMDTQLRGDILELKGSVLVSVLYHGTEETPFEWYETTVPIEGMLECQSGKESDHYEVKLLNLQPQVELKEDLDGEMRNIALDINADVELLLWKEEELEVLEDLYSLTQQIQIQEQEVVCEKFLIKNSGRSKIAGDIALDEMEEALYLCSSEGMVVIEEADVLDDMIHLEGKAYVDILYLTRDDGIPMVAAKGVFPFVQDLEAKGVLEDAEVHLQGALERLSVTLTDNHTATVKGEVQLNTVVLNPERIKTIQEAWEEDMDYDRLQNAPGMVGYIVQPGDSLWKIAKENYTTVTDLMEINDLVEDTIYPGQKLLIVKKVIGRY